MNPAIDKIVQAVLYEGYILYPYRASAKKNRQRFTFGRVYPHDFSMAQNDLEPSSMQTQCLVQAPPATEPELEVILRFLHPMTRDIGALAVPLRKLPELDNPDFFHVVPELEVDGQLHTSWQEVVEHSVHIAPQDMPCAHEPPRTIPFSFEATRSIEPIFDARQRIVGVIVRRQEAVQGEIIIGLEEIDENVSRLTVCVVNRTPVPRALLDDNAEIVMRTFASTHTILHVRQGEFPSLIDPPEALAEAAAACKNIGAWPVLVGDEARQDRDTMISSPIILYDYPKIAKESPGDLYDGGEIDEILTLRIMTLTDDEKREMRGVDDHARRILERTESLPSGDLLRMHGVMRPGVAAEVAVEAALDGDEAFFNPATRVESVTVRGVQLREGDLVRVRPKKRADAMDMALAGRVAMIESIEQDAENILHLALVLEDDPGRDLGLLRQPGHRFFYGTDEVEPLEGE